MLNFCKSQPNFKEILDVIITEKHIGQFVHSESPGLYCTRKGSVFEFSSAKHNTFCTYLIGIGCIPIFQFIYHPPGLILSTIIENSGKVMDWVKMSNLAEIYDIAIVRLVYMGPISDQDYQNFVNNISGYLEGYVMQMPGDLFYKIKTPWYHRISLLMKTLKQPESMWKMTLDGTLENIKPFLEIEVYNNVYAFEKRFYERLHSKSEAVLADIVSGRVKKLDSHNQEIYMLAGRALNISKETVMSVIMSYLRKHSDVRVLEHILEL
jgi:hypothetical protein